MNDLLLNVTLIRKLRWSLMCLSYFIVMLSMDVYATRQWQTSGRLVRELNVCTVLVLDLCISTRSSTSSNTSISSISTFYTSSSSAALAKLCLG